MIQSYEREIVDLLKGETPKQKYDNLKGILDLLERTCYPRRGTDDENIDIYSLADQMFPFIKNPNTEK